LENAIRNSGFYFGEHVGGWNFFGGKFFDIFPRALENPAFF
jgi:hypothetical protein